MNLIHRPVTSLQCGFLLCFFLLNAAPIFAQSTNSPMPQDYWKGPFNLPPGVQSYPAPGIGMGLAIDPHGTIYAGAKTNIQVYNSSFSYVTNFGLFGSINGMAFDTNGSLYVLDGSSNTVSIFDANQNLIGSFITPGSVGGTSFSMAISSSNEVFITDPNDYLVKVFSTNGTLLRQWGTNGNFTGQFSGHPIEIAITPDSKISVLTDSGSYGLQFDTQGNYITNVIAGYYDDKGMDYPWKPVHMKYSKDGYNANIGFFGGYMGNGITKYIGVNIGPINYGGNYSVKNQVVNPWFGGIDFMPNGDVVVSDPNGGKIWCSKRCYYGKAMPSTGSPAPPLPTIMNFTQRVGTTFVDIDYKVISTNTAPLAAAVLAFVNGQQDLNHLIIPTTFAENTQSNLGANITPNTPYHLTWNAAADWSTNTGSIQIEVLAQDGRPLQPQSWTYSPTNLPAKLTGTVTDASSMWLWLLAVHDPAVSLQTGTIMGVGGNYDGQTLATSSTNVAWDLFRTTTITNYTISTTSYGWQFLQDRVNAQVPLVISNTVAH